MGAAKQNWFRVQRDDEGGIGKAELSSRLEASMEHSGVQMNAEGSFDVSLAPLLHELSVIDWLDRGT